LSHSVRRRATGPRPKTARRRAQHAAAARHRQPHTTAGIQGEVRRCRGGSSKAAVACAIKAQSIEELNKCDFERTGKHGGHWFRRGWFGFRRVFRLRLGEVISRRIVAVVVLFAVRRGMPRL